MELRLAYQFIALGLLVHGIVSFLLSSLFLVLFLFLMILKRIECLNRECLSEMGKNRPTISFEWNDSFLSDLLLFRLPEIAQRYDDKTELEQEITSINGLLKNFQFGTIRRDEVLAQADPHFKKIAAMKDVRPIFSDERYYGNLFKLESRMILHGPGGMGKSEFLFQISQKMDEERIPHLTLYGKFVKKVDEISFLEIEKRAAQQRFVFIFDSLNEMEDGQAALLLDRLMRVKDNGNLYLIVSYRDGYFPESSSWLSAGFQNYVFEGVDYQSAVSTLIAHHPKVFFAYSDILESNNALFLNALRQMIDDRSEDFVLPQSVATITTLLEHLVEKESKEGWFLVKAMAKKMVELGRKYLREDEVSSLVYLQKDKEANHRAALLASGFLIAFLYEGKTCYAFGVDRLGDFLLSRSLMNLEPWDPKVIRERAGILGLSHEALLLMLWDKSRHHVDVFLKNTHDVSPYLECDLPTVKLISWRTGEIRDFQKKVPLPDIRECFVELGGVKDKPFNCVNFLDVFFSKNPKRYLEMVKSFSPGTDILLGIQRKLRNILASVDVSGAFFPPMEESFLFAYWCLGLGDRKSVLLAEKLLLEIATLDPPHVSKLLDRYRANGNIFIQEKIIDILAHLDQSFSRSVSPFFRKLLSSSDYLHADNEERMNRFLERKGAQPNPRKFDVIAAVKKAEPSLSSIKAVRGGSAWIDRNFLRVDFQYDDNNHSDFLDYPLSHVVQANRQLKKAHPCYNANGCRLFFTSERDLGKEVGLDSDHRLNNRWILRSIAYFYERIAQVYSPNPEQRVYGASSLGDTFYGRCLLLAQNQAYGSVMNHYFTGELYSENGDGGFRGFVPFNPLRFQDDGDNLWGLSPLFNPCASTIVDALEKKIRLSGWNGSVKQLNREREKQEIQMIASPVPVPEYGDSFLPFAILIRQEGASRHSFNGFSQWNEDCRFYGTYQSRETIHGLNDDRYLSIEIPDYWGNIQDYSSLAQKRFQCSSVPSFGGRGTNLPSASIVLPPASIVKKLSLVFWVKDGTWRRGNKVVFISNDGESSYYKNLVSECLFISQKAYQELFGDQTLSFFGYFERFAPIEKGTRKDQFHFEIKKGKIRKITDNTSRERNEKPRSSRCRNCPRYLESRKLRKLVFPSFLAKTLESYQGGSKKSDH